MHTLTGVSTTGVAVYLFVFGAAGVCGAVLAGRATDALGAVFVIWAALLGMTAALLGLSALAAIGPSLQTATIPAGLLVGAYALGTWALTPAQQHRLIGSDYDTRLLLSLNASALYGGVAIGAAAGGALWASATSYPSTTAGTRRSRRSPAELRQEPTTVDHFIKLPPSMFSVVVLPATTTTHCGFTRTTLPFAGAGIRA